MKKARSATIVAGSKSKKVNNQGETTGTDDEAQLFGLILTPREKEHIADLGLTCMYIETKKAITSFDMVEMLREYGFIRVMKEHETGFWCSFSDISNEDSIQKLIV